MYVSKFKINDKVLRQTEQGVYSTVMLVTDVKGNLIQCEWTHEGKKHVREILDHLLILDRNQSK